ncbi:helix-turn-helix transcriptional regulator [Aquimarina muelleri]|uniref:helix-turn-helix transcriptional regulator n=1 Tax=Aquimarina muelleri TaxID=279356 RepID=UPI003F68391D
MAERINRIKEVLIIKGMSQKELAVELDRNPNTVTSMCNNKSQPHLKDLKRIAEILDVDIRELLVPTKESKS